MMKDMHVVLQETVDLQVWADWLRYWLAWIVVLASSKLSLA